MRDVEAMIVWTPAEARSESPFAATAGKVNVVPWPDRADRSKAYRKSAGACSASFSGLSPTARLAKILLSFNTLVLRDRIAPEAAHAAFLKIDEYAEAIALDLEGARETEPHYVGITQDLTDDMVVDIKAAPTAEACVAKILEMARPELGCPEAVLGLLREALRVELNAEPPVHLNLQAALWALEIEGAAADRGALDARWKSIREALRNA